MPGTVWDKDKILKAIQDWTEAHEGIPPSSEEWGRADLENRWLYPYTGTVQLHFGKWSKAVAAAGCDAKAYHRLLYDPASLERTYKMRYEDGLTYREIAQIENISTTAVQYRLLKYGKRV